MNGGGVCSMSKLLLSHECGRRTYNCEPKSDATFRFIVLALYCELASKSILIDKELLYQHLCSY
jgi:hypothetical protein